MKRALKSLALALGASFVLAGCAEPAGLDVSVDVGKVANAVTLRVILTAKPGGFVYKDPTSPELGTRVTREDIDGDGAYELVTQFLVSPQTGKVTFRVTTGNRDALAVHGRALVFDTSSLLAKGDNDVMLPSGGHGELSLTLAPNDGEVVSPDTRNTDLGTATADVTIKGQQQGKALTAMAACDVDGDGHGDVVLGAPDAWANDAIKATGAVYVAFGRGRASGSIDLGAGPDEIHFYGKTSGDRLGSAVACADLDGDAIDDIIVGAPGAATNKGAVYVIFGRQGLATTPIDLAKPDVQWTTGAATLGEGQLGSVLFAQDLDGDKRAEILAAAPGARIVHLFTKVAPQATPIDADLPNHPRFLGVSAKSLGAGHFKVNTGPMDVVIGDHEFQSAGETAKRGIVYVYAAVPVTTPTLYTAVSTDPTGPTTTFLGNREMQLGAAVLGLDLTTRGQDLFIGAPNAGANGVGQVLTFEHNSSFFDAPMRTLDESETPISGFVPNGHFGSALAASPSGSAPSISWKLIVGAPDVRRGEGAGERALAGAAYVFGGNTGRAFPLLEQVFGAATGDRLGAVVAGVQFDADVKGDLLALAPNAAGADTGSGVVYVRLGQ